jgi:hypothetical protein
MNDSKSDALAGLRHEHLLYFAQRAYEEQRSVRPRRYGASSNAMVKLALGLAVGVSPSAYPADQHDLSACELAYATAPSDLQPLMLPTLERFRSMVANRISGRGVEWTVQS